MQIELDEKFYKRVRQEFEKYAKDYDGAMKRSAYFENQEQERIVQAEQDYEILEKFGAII